MRESGGKIDRNEMEIWACRKGKKICITAYIRPVAVHSQKIMI
jgi:hypothetical protein